MTDQSTRKRGRPRRNGPDEIWVSVPLPSWVVEHIDTLPDARGRTVARLFLEALASYHLNTELAQKIDEVLYG